MIIEFKGKLPQIDPTVYIAPNATIIGDVVIEAEASVWFGAVIRGDSGQIKIGARSNVQDNVVIHVNGRSNTVIEADVTLGHGAVLEGCHLERGVLIGMNATVLSGAVVGSGSLVAAGAVVGENQIIPPNVLVVGVPAKVKRELDEVSQKRLAAAPDSYVKYGRFYQTEAKIIQR